MASKRVYRRPATASLGRLLCLCAQDLLPWELRSQDKPIGGRSPHILNCKLFFVRIAHNAHHAECKEQRLQTFRQCVNGMQIFAESMAARAAEFIAPIGASFCGVFCETWNLSKLAAGIPQTFFLKISRVLSNHGGYSRRDPCAFQRIIYMNFLMCGEICRAVRM